MRYRIIFFNDATKENFVYLCEDLGQKKNYFTFENSFKDLKSGQYSYYIIQESGKLEIDKNNIEKSTIDGALMRVIDCGVAIVDNEQMRKQKEYDTEKYYKQYE